jgi:L-ribulose-5-phosphate 3-epimerase
MPTIEIGMNGRFFPNNWRPALQEIEFASKNNFRAMQFQGKDNGLSEDDLGASFGIVAEALRQNRIRAVMEIVVRVNPEGRTAYHKTPLEVLQANLPAITQLPCECVHWHLVPLMPMEQAEVRALEQSMNPQFAEAVALAKQNNFKFGFEHNEPAQLIFGKAESCAEALNAVPGLHFVWDFNHTKPDHLDRFTALIPRMSMLHISDTPLPEVNYHLPLG